MTRISANELDHSVRGLPGSLRVCKNRGAVHADKGFHDQAILDFSNAIEINPSYAGAFISSTKSINLG